MPTRRKCIVLAIGILTVFCFVTAPAQPAIIGQPLTIGKWRQSTELDFNGGKMADGNATVNGTGEGSAVSLKSDAAAIHVNNAQDGVLPPGYVYHATSFDEHAGVMVLFGGSSMMGGANDTWIYDTSGNSWKLIQKNSQPKGRYGHAMVYVYTLGVTLMFGGFSITNDKPLNDTWTYNLRQNTWTNITPVHSPAPRGYISLAYDNVRNKVLLFGGTTAPGAGKDFNDTWEFDAASGNWLGPIACANVPSGRNLHGLAFSQSDGSIWMFGGYNTTFASSFSDTWFYNGTNWNIKFPVTIPSKRNGHAMTYDGNYRSIVMYGGNDGGFKSDLWYWNYSSNNWSMGKPTMPTPPGTDKARMVYDITREVTLMYGGLLPWFTESRDVWTLDTQHWTWNNNTYSCNGDGGSILLERGSSGQLICLATDGVHLYEPAANLWTNLLSLSIRNRGAAAYLPMQDRVLLFGGGSGAATYFNDTLAFDFENRQWITLLANMGPSKRSNCSMIYDAVSDCAYLFGGKTAAGKAGDTWKFDVAMNKWTLLTPSGSPPSARQDSGMVLIPGTRDIILFGGLSTAGLENDTWVYNISMNAWNPIPSTVAPSKRSGHAMAWDAYGKQVFLFGGMTAPGVGFEHDIWSYNPVTMKWTRITAGSAITPRWKCAIAYCSNLGEHGGMIIAHGQGPGWIPFNDVWAYPGHRVRGVFESSKWDTGMSLFGDVLPTAPPIAIKYGKIWWNGTGPIGSLALQIRTAATKDGLNSSVWYGPTSTSDHYIVPGAEINGVHKDVNARWMQYRVVFNSSTPADTPALLDITITYDGDYVVPEAGGLLATPILITSVALSFAIAVLSSCISRRHL